MQVDELPKIDMSTSTTGCCPKFDPKGWDGQTLELKDTLFVRAETRALLHVPINMGSVFTRVQTAIEDAGAQDPDRYLVLSRRTLFRGHERGAGRRDGDDECHVPDPRVRRPISPGQGLGT